jgi:MoxR-like ATPase
MSCEENRIKYFERVSSAGGALANALGGESEARAALEQIFNTARSDGAAIRSSLQQHKAAGRTLQLFEEMERGHGLARPTHSTTGMRLPRRDAQFGYQAVYDTIEAARNGKALPDVAIRVLQQRQLRRTVSSVRVDDRGYYRCSNCGQFASRTRGHVCPFTARSADLERALQRRLGTPHGAYLHTDQRGQRADGLQELIDGARVAPGGTVRMTHCLTGEEADVTLDGAIPALSQGFVPGMWVGRPGLQHVELPDRRVVAVLDASGLNSIDPTSVLGIRSASALPDATVTGPAHAGDGISDVSVRVVAAAYGAALVPNAPVYSLGAPRLTAAAPSASTPHLAVVARASASLARAGVNSTSSGRGGCGTAGSPVLLKPTSLQGGTPYDWGHFTGSEYRKRGWHGAPVSACGRSYKVGDRSSDPSDWAQARRTGLEPPPKGGVAVGRTLVGAVDLLSKGKIVVSSGNGGNSGNSGNGGKGGNGGNGDQVQLYSADGSELVAVYDPSAHTAGDTNATTNASPEQLAAVIAYWEHLGRSRPDLSSPAVRSLLADIEALRRGSGSPLAVADSAYLVLRDHLRTGTVLTLGASVNTPRCPDCGRWMGDAHVCPARAQSQLPPVQPQAQPSVQSQTQQSSPLLGAEATPQAPSVALPVTPDASYPALADALGDAFDRLGDRLGEKLGGVLGERLGERLDGARSSQPQAPPSPAPSTGDERMVLALDRLAAILEERTSTPIAEPSENLSDATAPGLATPEQEAVRGRIPSSARVGGPRSKVAGVVAGAALRVRKPAVPPARPPIEEVPLTPQEHILMHVKPPELPDPYLSRLDASLGGQRAEPLPLHYEEIDTTYDLSESAEKALRIVSSSLQMAWDPNRKRPLRGTQMRVFGFAGTAGTGKNTTARQIAASLRLPYYETTLHRDTSLQEEIGQTVLQDGTTAPRLGPLGQAAASGGVICINELVKANPGTLGALQRMMEDGVFEVQGTEAGISAKEIPVHPSTIFVCTWNPGYDGSSDRPDAALLSRIPTIRLDAPDIKDETRRIAGSLGMLFGGGDDEGDPDSGASQQKEERRREILGQDYQVRRSQSPPSVERVEVAVRFVRDLRNLAQTRQIGASSRHLLEPTPREALHFAAMCEATGDPLLALEQFKIYCDSGEGYDEQFKLVQQIFKRYYGEDGQALNRRTNGEGPRQS